MGAREKKGVKHHFENRDEMRMPASEVRYLI
jgi:hypothetical protein